MRMSILLDATHWGEANPTGVGKYVDGLFPPLLASLRAKDVQPWLLGHHLKPPLAVQSGEWQYSPYSKGWGQFGVAKELKRLRPNLYFTPSGIIPLFGRTPKVMTVHDLAAFNAPEAFTAGQKWRLRELNSLAIRRSAGIITVSHFVQEQIMDRFGLKESQVLVAYPALPPLTVQRQSEPEWPLPTHPYILYVSRIETKKNLRPVIVGFAQALEHLPHLELLLAGKPGYGYQQITDQIAQLPAPVRSQIKLLGYVSDTVKQQLLEHALALVSPCPDEGFGLTVLEGFHAGTAVLAAQAGPLPEVVGQAGLLVEARRSEAWCKAILQVGQDPKLVQTLQAQGRIRGNQFSWEQCAQQVADQLIKWAK